MPDQLPITTYGMEILRKEVKPVKEVDTKLIKLVQNMYFTMDNADGAPDLQLLRLTKIYHFVL